MTKLNVSRKIGIIAPSGYGKTWAGHVLAGAVKAPVVVYDTDYEKDKGLPQAPFAFSSLKNVTVITPSLEKGEELGYLDNFIRQCEAKLSNAFIYITDLDVFFDKGNSLSFETSALKGLMSKGRHQRLGVIYDTKQAAFIPSKVIGNTNLFYIGKLVSLSDRRQVQDYITAEEIAKLDAKKREWWRIDTIEGTKEIVVF